MSGTRGEGSVVQSPIQGNKKSHQPGQESNEQPPIYPRLGLTAITCCVNRDAAHYTTETGDGCHAGFIHIKSENGLPAQLRGMGEL